MTSAVYLMLMIEGLMASFNGDHHCVTVTADRVIYCQFDGVLAS